jgi:hypothetical protein
MLLLQVTRMLLAEGSRLHKVAGFRVAVFKRGARACQPADLAGCGRGLYRSSLERDHLLSRVVVLREALDGEG